jgi:hypothetical protein
VLDDFDRKILIVESCAFEREESSRLSSIRKSSSKARKWLSGHDGLVARGNREDVHLAGLWLVGCEE